MSHVFVRFALPITWDFAELNPLSDSSGNYSACLEWVALVVGNNLHAGEDAPEPEVIRQSATEAYSGQVDAIITDPPYYDAIPYSDLVDFFYVWLRRSLYGLTREIDAVFAQPLSPKWDHDQKDGELIDDSSRFGGDKQKSKTNYEDGMARAFQACYQALKPDGRMVIVFAHKQPDAWETLVTALIRAGFVVDGSWPIQTEMGNRTRALSSAALASSVWLVCRKRDGAARPGWDNRVLEEMRVNIRKRLHQFWDTGIRGPDFVWAATGPALEAYSKHPIVKKVNEPGKIMSVSEFLTLVRRIVVDFVVGCVLRPKNGDTETASALDDVTTYYLLHRDNFGMKDAPIGPCILYAVSCNLRDADLFDKYNILQRTGGQVYDEEDDEDGGEEEGTSSTMRLKLWSKRKYAGMDTNEAANSTLQPRLFDEGVRKTTNPIPLIDQIHRLMHLWRAGDLRSVDEYIDTHGLNMNQLFPQVVQAIIELSERNSEERSLLESISKHIESRHAMPSISFNWQD